MAVSIRDSHLPRRGVVVSAALAIAAAAVFLGVVRCPMALVTHHPCPGCGLTRATIAALHGDFAGSLHHHPLAIVMVPFVVWLLTRNAYGYVVRGRWGEADATKGRWADALFIVLAVAMFGVWIARFFGFLGGPEPVG